MTGPTGIMTARAAGGGIAALGFRGRIARVGRGLPSLFSAIDRAEGPGEIDEVERLWLRAVALGRGMNQAA